MAEPTKVFAFRLPAELVARIDRHAERMRKLVPGLTFTRADALRALVETALREEEQEEKDAAKSRRR